MRGILTRKLIARPQIVLLKAIAEKIIPGIAPNMRILLVTQIVDADSSALDLTITQAVVKADTRREAATWEYQSQYSQS